MSDRISVLMIDDNPADGDIVRRYLEHDKVNWDIEFEHVLSASEAISALDDRQFDVLIVDYHFPFGDGFDILRKLRGEGVVSPAIMLTGEGDEKVAGKAVTENLSGYIPKADLNPEILNQSLEAIPQNDGDPKEIKPLRKETHSGTPAEGLDILGPGEFLRAISTQLQSSGETGILLLAFNVAEQVDDYRKLLGEDIQKLVNNLTDSWNDDRFFKVRDTVFGSVLLEEDFKSIRQKDDFQWRQIFDEKQMDSLLVNGIRIFTSKLNSSITDSARIINEPLDSLLDDSKQENDTRLIKLNRDE